jgi:hypothetical protein
MKLQDWKIATAHLNDSSYFKLTLLFKEELYKLLLPTSVIHHILSIVQIHKDFTEEEIKETASIIKDVYSVVQPKLGIESFYRILKEETFE